MHTYNVSNISGTFKAIIRATSAHHACLIAWEIGASKKSKLIARHINNK